MCYRHSTTQTEHTCNGLAFCELCDIRQLDLAPNGVQRFVGTLGFAHPAPMLLRTKTIPASSSSRARAVRVCAQNVSYSSQTVASTSHPVSTSTSSSAFCSQETRAPWWTALGAVAVITTASICPDAHAAYATAQPPSSYADAQVKREEGRYDENLMTKELKSFLEVLEKKGNSIKFEELQQQRLKVRNRVRHACARMGAEAHRMGPLYGAAHNLCMCHITHRSCRWIAHACARGGLVNHASAGQQPYMHCCLRHRPCVPGTIQPQVNFRRSPAGQVSLLSPQGRWYNVKADMQVRPQRSGVRTAQSCAHGGIRLVQQGMLRHDEAGPGVIPHALWAMWHAARLRCSVLCHTVLH